VCAASVRRFNAMAEKLPGHLCAMYLSRPALCPGKICGAEGLNNVETLSIFRSLEFGENME